MIIKDKNQYLKCGAKRKFVVLKIEDLENISAHWRFSLSQIQDAIFGYRLSKNKPVCPEYVVINTDEKYFWIIKLILKMFGHWG